MGSDSDKFDCTIPRSPITMLQSFGLVLKKLVPNALLGALGTLCESKAEFEHHISVAIPQSGFDTNTSNSQKKTKSTGMAPPNMADRQSISELLNSISEIKVVFSEAFHSLDLFENYIRTPGQETAKPLKSLFDRGKSAINELFTPENTDIFLDFLRTFLISQSSQDDNNEGKKYQEFVHESSNPVNRNLKNNNDLDSQPNSISKEASQLDFEKEKSRPCSPKFETNKTKFESKLSNAKQSDDTRHPESISEILQDNSTQASQEPRVMHKKKPDKIQTTKAKDFVNLHQEASGSQLGDKDIFDLLKPPALMKTMKKLEDENLSLRKQLESLEIKFHEYEKILVELGQTTVEETAKINEERKSELFQRIFRSPISKAKRSVVAIGYPNDHQNGYQKSSRDVNTFPKPQIKSESANPPQPNASVVHLPASSEQPVNGAEALVPGSKHQHDGEKKMNTGNKDENEFRGENQERSVELTIGDNSENQIRATQNSSSVTYRKKTSSKEGISLYRKVKHTSDLASTSGQGYDDLSISIEQDDSGRERISLCNVPPTSVATTLYNNYKFLLLSLGQRLLSSEVVKLRDWVTRNFSIDNPQNATDALVQLDQKGVINASDLSQLCDFFESIVRFDLVYIIDAFLLGDYSLLRQIPASKHRDVNRAHNPRRRATSNYSGLFDAVSTSQMPNKPLADGTLQTIGLIGSTNPATSSKPEKSNGAQNSTLQQTQQAASTNSKHYSRSPNKHQSTIPEQQTLKPLATGFPPIRMADVVAADGSVTNETRIMTRNSSPRTDPSVANSARNTQTVGSNGLKHSKFQRQDTERSNVSNFQSPRGSRNRDLDVANNWLCSHYKRHCYVKFECCDTFWPCHRCHNNQSTCGHKRLKSRDTKMVKCAHCNKVQQFGQFCCDCGAQFSEYYCGLCKHLTGKDDHPYHCERCGICRIHGDRSFHCDVCGVCLDVQLRGNHKCREGSAHDECCICLEDAFTGCQILPCSHKVHKECATQMIRSGITRCPICRESFAHKLERRPLPNSRTRSGK
ncbi:RING finger and CHY zinc finger domain-containing 1-like [Paramuricea clavata]|uniref:RING finger and CHY zinc finger domain-containing 1-like n=1 Tax=Paramuricea clavata TaxID=317549 RepID=A0A6S7GU55_PARCT|nr:RING finger and CHY zinc finger domain-containing 1-like [Paramuricea clavata]